MMCTNILFTNISNFIKLQLQCFILLDCEKQVFVTKAGKKWVRSFNVVFKIKNFQKIWLQPTMPEYVS